MFSTLTQVNTAILPLWQPSLAVLTLLLIDGDGQHHGPDHLLHQHHLQVVQGQGAGGLGVGHLKQLYHKHHNLLWDKIMFSSTIYQVIFPGSRVAPTRF